MNVLNPREAYRLWAPTYGAETAITKLDEELTAALSPSPMGMRLLDAGCGTGRRMPQDAALAVGVDLSPEMLAASGATRVAAADVRALPFADVSFDLVWCRLVLGHLADPVRGYSELARVCRPGGYMLVTDFHADAVAAGHKRRLNDKTGVARDIEHHVHDHDAHIAMAKQTGFIPAAQRDGHVGPTVKAFYANAGREDAYQRDLGLAVVAAFLFRRAA